MNIFMVYRGTFSEPKNPEFFTTKQKAIKRLKEHWHTDEYMADDTTFKEWLTHYSTYYLTAIKVK